MLCRRAIMPACEKLRATPANERPALNTQPLFIRLGDTVDFGIIWSDWAKFNHGKIKTSAWAAAGAPVPSPAEPAISGELVDQENQTTSFMLAAPASGDDAVEVGDEFYIENTVVFEKAADAPVNYADRTLTRRLHIKVAAG